MTLVTRDATSNKWVPGSAAEWTSLLSGTGIANPAFLWLCQEASGSLADSIGACTMAPTNSPGYQAAVTGWSRKAVSWADLSTSRFDNTTVPPDGSTTSLMFFGYMYVSSTPAGARYFMSLTNWAINLFVDGSGHQGILDNAAGTGTTVISDGVPRPFLVVYNRAAATCKMYTPTETLDGTYASSGGIRTVLGAYPALTTPAGGCLYACEWTGANAEINATQAATILDRLANGPAVTSIAVTPTPVTLAFIGNTQQLAATATRADGSTFDVTATATWSSSAPGVATVSSSGLVTAVAAGTANISCTYTSLNATTATSNNAVITVSALLYTAIDVSPSPGQAFIGGTKQFTAIGTLVAGGTADVTSSAVWSSSSPSVATVGAATGLASGLAAGSTLITATLGAFSSTVGLLVLASAGAANDLDAQQSKLYGEDVWFDVSHADALGNADYVVSPAGDWQDVDGVEALRQSLLRRLITNPGEWATLPDFGVGARQYIKALNTAANRAELEARVRSQFMADDRVESIESVTITEVTGDLPGLTIFVNVIPVGRLRQDATLPVQITIT